MTASPSFFARYWPVLCGILGAVVFVALIGGRTIYRPFNTPSITMQPTLTVGDAFLVDQFAYANTGPALGDVIVFHGPRNLDYIKRVAGLPGDHVQMINGVLYVNKSPVPTKRVADFAETDEFGITIHVPRFQETLPNGKTYFVLDRGDSGEDNTQDFLVPSGAYFVLGDNRDNSDDSRMTVGFVRSDIIVGRAATIYFSNGAPTWRQID